MTRKVGLLILGFIAIAWADALVMAATPPRQPNVVFILADDKY